MKIQSQSYENSSFKRNHSLYQMFSVIFISFMVISCVTINIYFPAAAAEKVAEQIVNDVLQSDLPDSTEDNNAIDKENKQSQLNISPLNQQSPISSHVLLAIVNFIIPVAEAGQADISINSPKINSIRKSMEKRQAKLRPFYNSGAVGFTNNGLIASVSNAGLSVKQKSTVKKLISSENRDRMALYSEIANANGHPEWQADIQKTFSKTWINKISSGWMYQSASGQWKKK